MLPFPAGEAYTFFLQGNPKPKTDFKNPVPPQKTNYY